MYLQHSAGVLAHPSSFPSPYGIGDLGKNSYVFIDFLHDSKMEFWQILPLGPTSFGDSPYQSFSTFAGNPMFIGLDILLTDGLLSQEDLQDAPEFDPMILDYGKTIKYKSEVLYKAYENSKYVFDKNDIDNYKMFCLKNHFWLDDYALFISLKNYYIEKRKYMLESDEYLEYYKSFINYQKINEIKDNFYGSVWNSWPEKIKNRDSKTIEEWKNILEKEIDYNKFLQYIFFKQWTMLKGYANKKNIKIIGDIPIFVALDSSDVWSNPELYHMNSLGFPTKVAGVPPDYFSPTGQLWGNPLYNWDKHKKTGYDWWITRVSHTLTLVDALRIDHFRGFDEYWAVKYGEETAKDGIWSRGPGENLFNSIKSKLGDLPIIAEDLGVITESVEELRNSSGFPGMRVLQFAFGAGAKNLYLPHNINTTNTVIYTGTHDNDTTIGWYSKADEKTKDHFRRYLNVSGDDPAWDLIRLAFSSIAALAIVPIQDIMRLDSNGRMNTPGLASGNWQFRYTADMLTDDMKNSLQYILEMYDRDFQAEEDKKFTDIEEPKDMI